MFASCSFAARWFGRFPLGLPSASSRSCTHVVARRYYRMAAAVVAGAGYALLGYWGRLIGLPMKASVGNAVLRGAGVLERIGSGRGDADVVAINLPIAMVGGLAFAMIALPSSNTRVRPPIERMLWVALAIASVPALIATWSRGGMYVLPVALCCLFYVIIKLGLLSRRQLRGIGVGMLLLGSPPFVLSLSERTVQVWPISSKFSRRGTSKMEFHGEAGLFSGRLAAWKTRLTWPATFRSQACLRGLLLILANTAPRSWARLASGAPLTTHFSRVRQRTVYQVL